MVHLANDQVPPNTLEQKDQKMNHRKNISEIEKVYHLSAGRLHKISW